MDLVYTICRDDHNGFLELKYSIRSMEKYLAGIDRLVIVGDHPDFLQNFYYIDHPDRHPINAGRNIYEKTRAACLDETVSENFIAAADDHFLLSPLATEPYSYLYDNNLQWLLQKLSKNNSFKPFVRSTYNALISRRLPVSNFSVHIPILYNKKLFIEIMDGYDWSGPFGFNIKSLYCNTIGITGNAVTDIKIFTPKTTAAIIRRLERAKFFSTDRYSINQPMIDFLDRLFPVPSRWEK